MDQVKELLQSVDSVKEAVNKLERKRRALHNAFDQRVSGAIQSVADLESRVDRVEADSAEMDDVPDVKADVDKCKASCKSARAKLEELRTKVLPNLQATGFDAVDLESAPEGDPCPQVTKLLADAEEFVKSAETLGFEVLRVKREFMKLIEELGESRENGQKTLEGLAANAARCAAEGMSEVAAEIKAAADLDFTLQSILDKAKDPEAFKKNHAKFLEQVSKAEAAVSAGLIELERKERERAERNEIDSGLDNARSKINDCLALIERAVVKLDTYEKDRQQLNDLKANITKLQQDGPNNTIEDLREKAKKISDEGDKAAVEIATRSEAAQKERKDDFKKKLSMWQNMNKN